MLLKMSDRAHRFPLSITPWLLAGTLLALAALTIGVVPLVDCPRCVKIKAMLDDALARSGPSGPIIIPPFQKCRICSERHKTTLFQRWKFAIAEDLEPGDYP
jgi:hypothetical protein